MLSPGWLVILGAGPTGLGAAYRCHELGYSDCIVLEASDEPGGLSRSFVDNHGFVWDIGGHVQFSHYEYFDRVMDSALGAEGWWQHKRNSSVWLNNRFVPYPFQNNLHFLDQELMWKCLRGLMRQYAKPTGRIDHFKDWIYEFFGPGIAEVFLVPYNTKVWAYPPERLSPNWVGERVARPNLEGILESIVLKKTDDTWGPNQMFRFPKRGGTGAIWKAVATDLPDGCIRYGANVTDVDLASRVVRMAGGDTIRFDVLLNTIPLDNFIRRCSNESDAFYKLADELVYSSSHIIGVGIEGRPPNVLEGRCWMYFPENDCPFYRVTQFSHYSPHNVPNPQNQWSLMAEVSESSWKPVDSHRVVEETLNGLRATGLLPEDAQVFPAWYKKVDHGYPTPFLGRDRVLSAIHEFLEPRQVYSRGRFGGWKYEVSNQDHSFMQGVEWVNKILLDVPETTYHFPDVANAGWGK